MKQEAVLMFFLSKCSNPKDQVQPDSCWLSRIHSMLLLQSLEFCFLWIKIWMKSTSFLISVCVPTSQIEFNQSVVFLKCLTQIDRTLVSNPVGCLFQWDEKRHLWTMALLRPNNLNRVSRVMYLFSVQHPGRLHPYLQCCCLLVWWKLNREMSILLLLARTSEPEFSECRVH